MLSSRTIKFLSAAILIAAAVFATTSMIGPSRLVTDHSMAVSNVQGLAQYHQSERAGQTAEVGLAKYYRSERGLSVSKVNIPQAVGLAQYHRSEWGLDESAANTPTTADLAIYFSSERDFPIRNLAAFNAYQRSEWFGQ